MIQTDLCAEGLYSFLAVSNVYFFMGKVNAIWKSKKQNPYQGKPIFSTPAFLQLHWQKMRDSSYCSEKKSVGEESNQNWPRVWRSVENDIKPHTNSGPLDFHETFSIFLKFKIAESSTAHPRQLLTPTYRPTVYNFVKIILESCQLLYARVLFFCEVNNNKNTKEYLCLGLLR